ncbi:MAG: hypothetical protein M1830_007322 [Pleopsidium flavum]|nr:MAG: hypothetical protein M1830_007322 [Pleopsidium flavum]
MAGLIAMTSVLIVVGIEMFFATRGAGHMHGSDYDTLRDDDEGHSHRLTANGHAKPSTQRRASLRPFSQGNFGANVQPNSTTLDDMEGSSDRLVAERSTPVPNDSPQTDHGDYNEENDDSDPDLDLDELDPSADAAGLINGDKPRKSHEHSISNNHSHYHRPRSQNHHNSHPEEAGGSEPTLSSQQQQQKMLLQCLLLEAGILFHSVFIGMALSVATGTSFIVLLVAISFHQTFEGIALGSRIAAITTFAPSSPKPWLMALAYGGTTPVGQAIGLLVHNLYDPASQTGLLMVGVMNAISSGLLLFAGLVELLAEDFLSDKSYEVLKGRRRLEACGAVVGGGLLMALVGAWA